MYAHSSCLAVAGYPFRLNPPDPPDARCRMTDVSPEVVLAPLAMTPRPRREGLFFRGILPALVLHMLFFGLLAVYEQSSAALPNALLSGKGNSRPPGLLIGQVTLPGAGETGPHVPAGQTVPAHPAPAEPAPLPEEPPEGPAPAGEQDAVPLPLPRSQEKKPPPSKAAPHKGALAPQPELEKRSAPARPAEPPRIASRQSAAKTGGATASGRHSSVSAPTSAGGNGSDAGGNDGGASVGLTPFGGTHGPSFKRFVQPQYPAQARRQGITGRVVLRVHLSATGKVEGVEVVESAHELLDKAALEAVRRSTFLPLQRNGKAVACRTELPVSFTLERTD